MVIKKGLVAVVILLSVVLYASSVLAASGDLRGAHLQNEVACADCHGTDSPDKPAVTSACLNCHGSYADLAELTKDVEEANPHASHLGELDCGECHGIHKESQVYCNQECHNFDMVAP